MIKIVFSPHALLKLRQRNIPQGLATEAIRFPDFSRPSRNLREERYKRFGKNYMKAIVVEEYGVLTVITVHWLARIKNK